MAELSNEVSIFLYDMGLYPSALLLLQRALEISEKALGPDHPSVATSLHNLAMLLRVMGRQPESALLYRKLLETQEKVLGQKGSVSPSILNYMAIGHNDLAFHTEVPAKNWKKAEYHYRQAIELFKRVSNPQEVTNAGLNLQTLFWLSGQSVDLVKVKELTKVLEEAKDKRAEKGYKLIKELS